MVMLYHVVPDNLTGDTLYPLNVLQNIYPDVYYAHLQKYEGHTYALQLAVPILNCLWNDVLHFSMVHPAEAREAWLSAGFEVPPKQHFEIDAGLTVFNEENTVIYLAPDSVEITDESFMPYSLEVLENIAYQISDVTEGYYRASSGQYPMQFYRAPHVLYRGSLNINGLNVITV